MEHEWRENLFIKTCQQPWWEEKRQPLSSSILFSLHNIYIFFYLQFLLLFYIFYTPSLHCSLALSSFGSLPCFTSCGSYANAGINHYANVTVNHYANVTVPTCQTGGKAAYEDQSFPLLLYSLYPFMYSIQFYSLDSFFIPPSPSLPPFILSPTGQFLATVSPVYCLFFFFITFVFNFTLIEKTRQRWEANNAAKILKSIIQAKNVIF